MGRQVKTCPIVAYQHQSVYDLMEGSNFHKLVRDINQRFGTDYKHGCSSCIYDGYLGGVMSDWVYQSLKVNRTYVVELRDICPNHGDYQSAATDVQDAICEFQPPANRALEEIVPSAWYGFKELVEKAYKQDCSHEKL